LFLKLRLFITLTFLLVRTSATMPFLKFVGFSSLASPGRNWGC